MTRERISLIFELTVMFLSFHKGCNLVSAAVVCAILTSISGLEPSSVIINPKYLKLVTVSSLCSSLFLDLCADALCVVLHQFGLFGTDLHAV